MRLLLLALVSMAAACPTYGHTGWSAPWRSVPGDLINDGALRCNQSYCAAVLDVTLRRSNTLQAALLCRVSLAAAFRVIVTLGDDAVELPSAELVRAELGETQLFARFDELGYMGPFKTQLNLTIQSREPGAWFEVAHIELQNCDTEASIWWVFGAVALLGALFAAAGVLLRYRRRRRARATAQRAAAIDAAAVQLVADNEQVWLLASTSTATPQ